MHTFSIGYTVLLQAVHFSCVPANINDAFVGALVCCISTGNYEYIKQCSWLPSALLPPILCISHSSFWDYMWLQIVKHKLPVKSQVLTTKEKCNFTHVPGLQLVTSAKEILYCMTISTGTREIPTSLSTWNTGVKVCAAYSWKTSHSIDLKTRPLRSIQEIAPLPCQMEASSLLFRIQSKMCQLKNPTMFHIANVLHLFKCSHCQSKVG
jgi:hypothetical protein